MERSPVNARANAPLIELLDELIAADREAVEAQAYHVQVPRVLPIRPHHGKLYFLDVPEQLGIASGDPAARRRQARRLAQLLASQSCRDVGHVVFESGGDDLIVPAASAK